MSKSKGIWMLTTEKPQGGDLNETRPPSWGEQDLEEQDRGERSQGQTLQMQYHPVTSGKPAYENVWNDKTSRQVRQSLSKYI